MFAWKTATWDDAAEETPVQPTLDIYTTGMIAGTKVATRIGWIGIETIRPGQEVLTFDAGLQTVVAVTRHALITNTSDTESWPLHVPAGALGNCKDMTLLPHQPVLFESDLAEEMTGDPFALIPSLSLVGLRGITQMRPEKWIEVIQLHFARDEIVFANIGALFLCRAASDLISDTAASPYEVLSMDIAEDLVDCLMFDDEGRAPPLTQDFAVA